MALHLIVDGYNLIRQSRQLDALDRMDLQLGREALLEQLVAYKRLRGHTITVVFDGTNAPVGVQHRDRVQDIVVHFSRQGELADTVIKRMAAREREKALVVSSDNDVVQYARRQGAATIDAPTFEEKLMLASYMDIKGDTEEASPGWTPTTRKKGPRRRLTKRQRKNEKKLAKL